MDIITVDELKARIDAGEKLNLIDCREPFEYAEFNIGAKLIPLGDIQRMQIEEIEDLKEEEIIIHCRSGQRSMMACMFLDTLGYKNTKNLIGGVKKKKKKFGSGK